MGAHGPFRNSHNRAYGIGVLDIQFIIAFDVLDSGFLLLKRIQWPNELSYQYISLGLDHTLDISIIIYK